MQISAYLNFDGRCEEAFRFYETALGGKIEMMMPHAGSPMEQFTVPEWMDKIMHARLSLGGQLLMGSDAPPGRFKTPQGFSVSLMPEDVAEAERVFAALAEGGTVEMPIQTTFWAARFGMLTDRFGIAWMVNCEAGA